MITTKLVPNSRSSRTLRTVQTRKLMMFKRKNQIKKRPRKVISSQATQKCLPCQKNKQNRLVKYRRR